MSLHHIIIFGILVAASLGLLLWALPVRNVWARSAVVLLVLAITANYLIWRISSLPALEGVFGSLWPWAFFLMELMTLTYEVWTYVVMIRRSDHRLEADRYECRLRATDGVPTVDVFIATYNEELAILNRTIRAALQLDYPRHLLRIIVGDDGARHELQNLALELGVDYLARPTISRSKTKVGGAGKAGNDRYSFAHSHGDFIVLLDADFCVRPEFLYRTLGFLLYRPGIGLVQTPQRFSNADVIGHNLGARRHVPEDQHFFMSITQSCRDAWGNAFCTGTACVVARRALRMLNPVWGFPDCTICEDLELTYALMEAGYRTLYLNEPLASGLAPESIPDFLKQRVRWCAGTVQNLYAPTGPIRGHHRLIDRIFYLEGVFYWLGSLFAAMLIFAPVVFWFTGVSAVLGSPEAAAAAVFPRLVARELTMFWLSEGKVPPVVVQVSRVLSCFHVSVSFVRALLCPRSPVFQVTGKGHPRNRIVIRWRLSCGFLLIALAASYGMLTALFGRSEMAAVSDLVQMNVAWTIITILICVLCSLACVELPYPGDGPEVVRSNPAPIAGALIGRCLGFGIPRVGGVE
jgi:cellulose synthase (UDP-forming)